MEMEKDFKGPEGIRPELLETLDYEYPGRRTVVEIRTAEFTSVCPWSGLPDFADLSIRYVPGDLLVEMKSLKLYLLSYRSVGILQEHAVNRILDDLAERIRPVEMEVEAHFRSRGGLETVVRARFPLERAER